MLKRQNQSNALGASSPSAPFATIINTQTEIPISCDECDCETHYPIGYLRTLPRLTCGFCRDSREFSQLEMHVLETALKQMGFFLAGAK